MAGARLLVAACAAGATLAFATWTAAPTPTLAHDGTASVSLVAAAERPAPLAPVTEHAIDLRQRGSGGGVTGQTLAQPIRVEVRGAGLALAHDDAEVVLHWAGDRMVGTLPPVRVIDARGTHEGWTVRYRVEGVEDPASGRALPIEGLVVTPAPPLVVSGLPDGLASGPRGSRNGAGVLFSARAGTGGGTYEAGADVEVLVPEPAARAIVRFVLDVH